MHTERAQRRARLGVRRSIHRFHRDRFILIAIIISSMFIAPAGAETQPSATRATVDTESLPLEEIVVTGTHIRGTGAVGADVLVIDRAELEKTGLATTQDVLHSVTQSFGGGASEATIGSANSRANFNVAAGAGINLRGLGTDATLVLLNGHRVAPSGRGTFVDLSQIPLSAVERIEVLTDGASALYGSDAIGGVVNVVLRKDFDGAEAKARFSPDTGNDFSDHSLGLVFGNSWNSGHATAIYELFERDPLHGHDRDYYRRDLTPFGGDDFRSVFSNPGTINAYTLADGTRQPVLLGIPAGQDGRSLDPADLVDGQTNRRDTQGARHILPGQKRHSLFLSAEQALAERIGAFAEVLYSKRDVEYASGATEVTLLVPSSNPFFVDAVGGAQSLSMWYSMIDDLGALSGTTEAELYSAGLGVTIDVSETWQATLKGTFSKDVTLEIDETPNSPALAAALADPDPSTAFNPFGDGANTNPATIRSILGFLRRDVEAEANSFHAKADGSLPFLLGGTSKLAVGMEYREEKIRNTGLDFRATDEPVPAEAVVNERDLVAAFAELYLPFVSSDEARAGMHALEASIAARYEDYSDFGTTINPKVGLRWSPVPGVDVRATFSESFKAPLLEELVDSAPNRLFFTWPIDDPLSPTGVTNALVLRGQNPDLGPEEARTYTFGIDFEPEGRDLSAGLTWFDIEVRNKVADLSNNIFVVLEQEDVFASVITRDPDPAAVAPLFTNSRFSNTLGLAPEDVEAIVDFRLNNISVTEVSGLDLDVRAGWETAAGYFNLGLRGSYYLKFEDALSESAPRRDLLDTVNHPVDWRARGELSWSGDRWGLSTFIDHVDGYVDNASNPQREVPSWTTVDLSLRYAFGDGGGRWSEDAAFAVSVQNAFDRDPPFVNNQILRIGYDPENADARGRVLAFQVTKQW